MYENFRDISIRKSKSFSSCKDLPSFNSNSASEDPKDQCYLSGSSKLKLPASFPYIPGHVSSERWLSIRPQIELAPDSKINRDSHQGVRCPQAIRSNPRMPSWTPTGRETERICHRFHVKHPGSVVSTGN